LKRCPLFRFMPEPFSQCIARRNVLHPNICFRRFFRHYSRPHTTHQHAPSISFFSFLVNSLYPHHRSAHLSNANASSCTFPFVLSKLPSYIERLPATVVERPPASSTM